MSDPVSSRYPITLAPGIFWVGECEVSPRGDGDWHFGNWVYLVAGETGCAIVEAGITHKIPAVTRQVDELIAREGLPPVRYVFITHPELPHAGGVGHLLERFPEAVVCGDVSDLHLVFPQSADRLRFLDPGDRLDLGGTELLVVEGVMRDLPYTRWAFDTSRRVLFTGDGFSFMHTHPSEHCGLVAEDVPGLDIAGMTESFASAPFWWSHFTDNTAYLERQDRLVLDELKVELIAPTHGLPIRDPQATLPEIRAGMARMYNHMSHTMKEG